jgi:hypothetical protein
MLVFSFGFAFPVRDAEIENCGPLFSQRTIRNCAERDARQGSEFRVTAAVVRYGCGCFSHRGARLERRLILGGLFLFRRYLYAQFQGSPPEEINHGDNLSDCPRNDVNNRQGDLQGYPMANPVCALTWYAGH